MLVKFGGSNAEIEDVVVVTQLKASVANLEGSVARLGLEQADEIPSHSHCQGAGTDNSGEPETLFMSVLQSMDARLIQLPRETCMVLPNYRKSKVGRLTPFKSPSHLSLSAEREVPSNRPL